MEYVQLPHSTVFYWKIKGTHSSAYLFNRLSFRHQVNNVNISYSLALTIRKHTKEIYNRGFCYNVATVYNKFLCLTYTVSIR